MSSAVNTDSLDIAPPMELLVLPQGVDVPPQTQERVTELGVIATELAGFVQHIHDTDENVHAQMFEIIKQLGENRRSTVLSEMVTTGLVSKHEAGIISEISLTISDSLSNDFSFSDGANQNILSMAYVDFAQGNSQVAGLPEMQNTPNEKLHKKAFTFMKSLDAVATAVAGRGQVLLEAETIKTLLKSDALGVEFIDVLENELPVGKKLASDEYPLDQITQALNKFMNNGFQDGSILRTLHVLDIYAFSRSIPDDILANYSPPEAYNLGKHDQVFVDFINSVSHPHFMKRHIDRLFWQVAPEEHGQLREKAANLLSCNTLLSSPEVVLTARALTEGLNIAIEKDKKDSQTKKDNLGDRYNAIQKTLMQDLKLYLEQAPSPSRMLGALSVEAALVQFEYTLTQRLTDLVGAKPVRTLFSFVQDMPLHDAVTQTIESERANKNEMRTVELEQIIGDINNTYVVSGKQIRELVGGKELRKKLEDWKEPGSQRIIFGETQAQQLAGLSLKPEARVNLIKDLQKLESAWIELSGIQKGVRRNGLLASIDTLMEVYEAANPRQLNDRELQPIWKLLDDLTAPEVQEAIVSDNTEPDPDKEDIYASFPHFEPLQAFPPEPAVTDIAVEDIVQDFTEYASRTPKQFAVEWERIQSLIKLHAELQSKGYPVAALRLSASNWHALPHYVLEVKGKGDNMNVVAVIESPVYGNATYVVAEADWRDVVSIYSKKETRMEFDAVARVHADGKTTDDHRLKLMSDIMNSLKP